MWLWTVSWIALGVFAVVAQDGLKIWLQILGGLILFLIFLLTAFVGLLHFLS